MQVEKGLLLTKQDRQDQPVWNTLVGGKEEPKGRAETSGLHRTRPPRPWDQDPRTWGAVAPHTEGLLPLVKTLPPIHTLPGAMRFVELKVST